MADPYDADLDWWFHCGDSLLGEKGNLSSTISALERGGANTGVFEEPWSNLDLGKWHSDMAKERRIRARFLSLDKYTQKILIAHYSSEPRKIPHLTPKFGQAAGVILLLASGKDIFGLNKVKEVRSLEAAAKKAIRDAHQLWRATNPKKAKHVLQDFEIPLPVLV